MYGFLLRLVLKRKDPCNLSHSVVHTRDIQRDVLTFTEWRSRQEQNCSIVCNLLWGLASKWNGKIW